jgi:hypothetical protein
VVEHATENRGVGSSTLPLGTKARKRRDRHGGKRHDPKLQPPTATGIRPTERE